MLAKGSGPALSTHGRLKGGAGGCRGGVGVGQASAAGAVALTTFTGIEAYPSFSPDGNHVAFTWNGPKQDNPDIYVQQIGAGSPLRLTTDPRNDYNPVWSPDGRWIAFLRRQSQTGEANCDSSPLWAGRSANWPRSGYARPSGRRTLPGVRTAVVWSSRIRRARESRTPCSSFHSSQEKNGSCQIPTPLHSATPTLRSRPTATCWSSAAPLPSRPVSFTGCRWEKVGPPAESPGASPLPR